MKAKYRLLPSYIDSSELLPSYQLDYNNLKNDELIKLSKKHWSNNIKFSESTVNNVFFNYLLNTEDHILNLLKLNYSSYLEKYLIPNLTNESSDIHIISIILLLNQNFKVSKLESIQNEFPIIFNRLVKLLVNGIKSVKYNKKEYNFPKNTHNTLLIQTELIKFFIKISNNLTIKFIRVEVIKFISIGVYSSINRDKLINKILPSHHNGLKLWNAFNSELEQLGEEDSASALNEINLIYNLIQNSIELISKLPKAQFKNELNEDELSQVKYCEAVIELIIDLLSMLRTRRFLIHLVEDCHYILLLQLSPILSQKSNSINQHLVELVNRLKLYFQLEVDENTGAALTPNEIQDAHYQRLSQLQLIAFKQFKRPLEDFYLTNIAKIDDKDSFISHISNLSTEELIKLCELVYIRTKSGNEEYFERPFLLEALAFKYQRPINPIDILRSTPLYPTEATLFDPKLLQAQLYNGSQTLSIPKLGTEFLSIFDYFYRNFYLYQYESLYSIWQDIEDVLRRLNATYVASGGGSTEFMGWARMGIRVQGMQIVKVSKPKLGEAVPSEVLAELTIDLSKLSEKHQIEWMSLKPFDTLFLTLVDAKNMDNEETSEDNTLPYGIKYIRGCEVAQLLTPDGKNIDPYQLQSPDKAFQAKDGRYLSVRVKLDPNQYTVDTKLIQQNFMPDIYTNFNLLIRRNPRENQFKSVLETIRDLIDAGENSIPEWLKGGLLGYDDVKTLHYSYVLEGEAEDIDFRDTFLDSNHLRESFSDDKFIINSEGNLDEMQPPFKIEFQGKTSKKKKKLVKSSATEKATLNVTSYKYPNLGPFNQIQQNLNTIKFTPTQVEAIRSGCNPGLTMIVGPPGTGKTDVAVQIISNLYHNNPNQRILLVTHSNHALNRLFEKIQALDIDDNHLLRLGHGTDELLGGAQFGKYGRLDSFLEKRFALLKDTEKLVTSLGFQGANHADTCETSVYFFEQHVLPSWAEYLEQIDKLMDSEDSADSARDLIISKFPFTSYFSDAPQPIFSESASIEELKDLALGCYRHLKSLYDDLFTLRPLELLRNSYDRANYLLTNCARIVAMTCTHAALKRQELIRLGFKYNTVIMEEAGQILEIETAIPLLLQSFNNSLDDENIGNQVKRVILLGDNAQLPPIVKGLAFQNYGNMECSMFDRLIQLGVQTIILDRQGRARPKIADLYRMRYPTLQDLPKVQESEEYLSGNTGLSHTFQLINVEDYQGKGETQPQPYFYQNLGEAEYLVSMYQYMRLLGYPSDKITILTTYAGQKALIQDVLEKRCGWNDFFKPFPIVSTVDGYQGEQNDYILLSLVRTSRVGYIRDIRRWTTALSRARLGLYIFCRQALFSQVPELSQSLSLIQNPQSEGKLSLVEGESYPTKRADGEEKDGNRLISDVVEMGKLVFEMVESGDFIKNEEEYINPEDLAETNFEE